MDIVDRKPDDEALKRAVERGNTDPDFWHSRTPEERMIAVELMRRRVYGYDENSMPRIKRVIEFAQLKQYQNPENVSRHKS